MKSKYTKKIQFNHFSAYLNFRDLLITPKELPPKEWHPSTNKSMALPIK